METFKIGFEAGRDCAAACLEQAGEVHRGEPIWPGDFECVAERLGCNKNSIDETIGKEELKTLWKGFKAGVNSYNEEAHK